MFCKKVTEVSTRTISVRKKIREYLIQQNWLTKNLCPDVRVTRSFAQKGKSKSPPSPLEYKPIPKERVSEVLKHLRDVFYADEPLNKAAALCKKGEGNAEMEKLNSASFEENFSLMAVNKSNEIAGVILNGTMKPGDTESSMKKINKSNDEKFKKVMNVIYSQNMKCDIFKKFQVNQVFEIRVVSVDPRFRGQRIAQDLIKHSLELAKNCDFKMAKGDATGVISQKILKSFGFEVLHELCYAEYTDDCGKPILVVDSPHVSLQILYKKLDCN